MFFQGRLCASTLIASAGRVSTGTLRTASGIRPSTFIGLKVNTSPAAYFLQFRNLHSVKFSRNLEYFCASDDLPLPKNTIQLGPAFEKQNRPTTLLFCWLMSKDKHIRKYAQFYNNLGMDVLKVRISPYDLLRPTKGSQCVANQVLQFLHANPSQSPLLIHGFSVGAYVFTEVMVQVEKEFEKHGHLLNRFVGQIWDSAVDLHGIPIGTSRAITNNVTLQKSMQKYLEWYLKVRYNTATIHYERASDKMHQNYVGVPSLFFISDSDPVSTPEMVSQVYNKWETKGHDVFTKCWTKSRHVSHYRMYQKEYEDLVLAFLERIRLMEPSSQVRASSL